jgi:hypothetical protein
MEPQAASAAKRRQTCYVMVMGFPQPIAKGQGGNFCLRGNERSGTTWANGRPSRFGDEAETVLLCEIALCSIANYYLLPVKLSKIIVVTITTKILN